jgi:O-antigen/teichoic acid export membrane protein
VTPATTTTSEQKAQRTQRYLTNVLWTWFGVGAGIVSAILLQPYVIKKLGDVDVSIWILVLSVVEYYWLIDLGFRSATVKMSAQFRAAEQPERLNELISTSLTYTMMTASVVILVTFAVAPFAERIWRIHRPVFPQLILIAGTSFALGMVFNIFGACVEGFQRFDLLGRIWITTTAVRSIGVFLILYTGHGLLWLGFMLLGAQCLSYLMTYMSFRHVAPGIRVSWRLATFSMLRRIASYGLHTFTTIISGRLLSQGLPSMIAYLLPTQSVVYYMTPLKIMDYAMDGVGRVGMVTTPNAAELMAKGRQSDVATLGMYANRYCLCLFLPLVSILLVYGMEIYSLWVNPTFAAASAYLLPVMVLSHAAVSGQFNSVSILFGMERHKIYSRCLLAEALITLAGMWFVLPRFGLFGGALVAGTAMVANRSIGTCLLLSRELKISAARYAARIYLGPVSISAAVTVLLYVIKRIWLPGRNWPQLALAATLMLVPYLLLTFRYCLAEHHRDFLKSKLRFPGLRPTAS